MWRRPRREAGAGSRARHASRAHPALRSRVRARPRGRQLCRGGRPATLLDDDARREVEDEVRPGENRRGRIPWPPIAISSTRPARGRRAGSTSSARQAPMTGRRASRARSGTTYARSSSRRTSCGGRGDVRSPRRPGRSSGRLRNASACAPPPHLTTTDAEATTALARANGWDRRLDRARAAFSSPTRLTQPAVLRQLEARGDVRRDGAGAVRGLLVDVVRRACHRSAGDRRPGRRAAARPGRPPGAVPTSSPACPSGSASTRWRSSGSTTRSCSLASAP